MRKAKPTLRKVTINGGTFYQVSTPNPGGSRPTRKTFKSKKDADADLKAANDAVERSGDSAFRITPELRELALRAAVILDGTDKSLVDAARFYRDHLNKTQQGKPVADAVAAFLEMRKAGIASYRSVIEPRLNAFSFAYGDQTTASITPRHVREFLAGLSGYAPRTVSHFRAAISNFFTFCVEQEWATVNPVINVKPPKVTAPEPSILKPKQVQKLLESCDESILPGLAIALFCGLRWAEIQKLEWSAVNLSEKIITVGAAIAKTNSRRVVSIPDNAIKWIRLYSDRSGRVWPDGSLSHWNLARIAAGYGPFSSNCKAVQEAQDGEKLTPWPTNALRHSAISYRLAVEKDLSKIAYESGNSPAVIQKHYNGLAAPSAAKAFFAIVPGEPANIITIAA